MRTLRRPIHNFQRAGPGATKNADKHEDDRQEVIPALKGLRSDRSPTRCERAPGSVSCVTGSARAVRIESMKDGPDISVGVGGGAESTGLGHVKLRFLGGLSAICFAVAAFITNASEYTPLDFTAGPN